MSTTPLTPMASFAVQGSGSKPYRVEVYGDGNGAWCTCPAMRFQKGKPANERSCKHTVRVIKVLALGADDPTVTPITGDEVPEPEPTTTVDDIKDLLAGLQHE